MRQNTTEGNDLMDFETQVDNLVKHAEAIATLSKKIQSDYFTNLYNYQDPEAQGKITTKLNSLLLEQIGVENSLVKLTKGAI